ncbi:MAG: substrate-binding domain-containing protein [Burkholderiaceae bacterium]
MHRVQLHYSIGREASDARTVLHPLPALLKAVAQQGSISGAARSLGLSYRHVWGALKRWEVELGNELLHWDKGQAAQLSDFGRKMLWAEQQAQARLAPQIAALQAELERALALAFDPHTHVLPLYASHDDALPLLRSVAADPQRESAVHLDIRFTGSVDAIRALNEGRCTVAGFHLPVAPPPTSLHAAVYRPLLQPGQHKLIGFTTRALGLIVPAGNPRSLLSLNDVVRQRATLCNRPLGTGTRLMLDSLLQSTGHLPRHVQGYDQVEPSHDAAAQAVASAQADVALGIAPAAHRRGLGFVPLVQERYYLVCLRSQIDSPGMQRLRQVMSEPAWHALCRQLEGYAPSASGQVLSLRRELPWWTFRRPKRGTAPR